MFGSLYEWLQNISYYLILVTAVTYVLPSGSYRKYIRFFTGLVLILMLLIPVMNLFRIKIPDGDEVFEDFLSRYENNMPEYLDEVDVFDDKNNNEVRIEVEDVVIGH